MYTDLVHEGGATYIGEDGLNNVIRYLHKHPEGAPMKIDKADDPFDIQKCERFTEVYSIEPSLFRAVLTPVQI